MGQLRIRNWDKWQSYRRDRPSPPWIKVYRALLRDPNFIVLTDAQKFHWVGLFLLASERNGIVSDDPKILQKQLCSDEEIDVSLFLSLQVLEKTGKRVRRRDSQMVGVMAPSGCHFASRATEADTETEEGSLHVVRSQEVISSVLVDGGEARTTKTEKNGEAECAAGAAPPKEQKALSQKSSKRGSRWSAERVPDAWKAWASQEHGATAEQVRREEAKFCDYWVAKAGQGGVKLDWRATWRNWIRRAAENAPRSNGKPSAVDRVREANERWEAEQAIDGDYERVPVDG